MAAFRNVYGASRLGMSSLGPFDNRGQSASYVGVMPTPRRRPTRAPMEGAQDWTAFQGILRRADWAGRVRTLSHQSRLLLSADNKRVSANIQAVNVSFTVYFLRSIENRRLFETVLVRLTLRNRLA